MKKDKNTLQERFRCHQSTPPHDGWKRLEASLSAMDNRHIRWRREFVALAAAAIVCGVTFLVKGLHKEAIPSVPAAPQIAEIMTDTNSIEPFETTTIIQQLADAQTISTPIISSEKRKIEKRTEVQDTMPQLAQVVSSNKEESTEKTEHKQENKQQDKQKSDPRHGHQPYQYNDISLAQLNSKKRSRLSFGLFSEGKFYQPGTTYMKVGDAMSDMAASAGFEGKTAGAPSGTLIPVVMRDLPISIGLQGSYQLTDGLSLVSGLTATRHHTTLTYQLGTKTSITYQTLNQQLVMVGIPIGLQQHIWDNKHLSLYAGAGGIVEHCVSARLDNQKLKKPGLQYALSCQLGLGTPLSDHLTLYVEPNVSYYLTELEQYTYQKDQPFVFSLRFLLQYNP